MGNKYKQSMNLPTTDFPMRANLPENEPKRLEWWNDLDIYRKVLEKNKDNEPFVLHDGPPYANGPIHIGHAFNKILKDFVKKAKKCEIKGGIIEGEFMDAAGVNAIADLPPRDVLIARLLGSMMSPISGLAIVLDQIAKKMGGGEAQPEAAAE